ncbi:hypothetical protein HYS47_00345 [Candidatus Woesearchaeota archaeon]|nr:hypothetical protein [Candidatus Woesearchaeota archaeon]
MAITRRNVLIGWLASDSYKKEMPELWKNISPYDQKTRDFIFFGTLICEPCRVVADYLLEQKIRFREKDLYLTKQAAKLTGSSPMIVFQDQIVIGYPDIIKRINEMYGIQE